MKILRSLRLLLPVALLVILSGCASVDPKDETLSMVYGYMGGHATLTSPITWGKLKDVGPSAEIYDLNVERDFWERGGLFWHMGVKPGTYQLGDFGVPNGTYEYGKSSKNITTFRINQPGLYYMGSYWHTHVGKVIVSGFEVKKINTPTEREIVQRLIKLFETEGDDKVYVRQYNLLKKRLAQLPA